MSTYRFWEQMQKLAEMNRLWWYTYLALPMMIVAGSVFLLMLFALRRKSSPPAIFFWLLLASLPALLIYPSFYVSVSLEPALARVGFAMPANEMDFSGDSARKLGQMLDALAFYGIIGASLTVVVMGASSLVGDVPVASPIIQQISQSLTKAITRTFNPVRGASVKGKYGMVRVTQGSQTGSLYAVRNGTIGKQETDITITDAIVSRKHARFEVIGGVVKLWDEDSRNGTYVQRNGQTFELNGEAFAIEFGDTIFLGPPDLNTSVAMVYEQSGG